MLQIVPHLLLLGVDCHQGKDKLLAVTGVFMASMGWMLEDGIWQVVVTTLAPEAWNWLMAEQLFTVMGCRGGPIWLAVSFIRLSTGINWRNKLVSWCASCTGKLLPDSGHDSGCPFSWGAGGGMLQELCAAAAVELAVMVGLSLFSRNLDAGWHFDRIADCCRWLSPISSCCVVGRCHGIPGICWWCYSGGVKIVVQSISHCCLVARTGQSVCFQMGAEWAGWQQ